MKSGKRAIDSSTMPPGKQHGGRIADNSYEITKAIPPGADHQRDGLDGIPAKKSKTQR